MSVPYEWIGGGKNSFKKANRKRRVTRSIGYVQITTEWLLLGFNLKINICIV